MLIYRIGNKLFHILFFPIFPIRRFCILNKILLVTFPLKIRDVYKFGYLYNIHFSANEISYLFRFCCLHFA